MKWVKALPMRSIRKIYREQLEYRQIAHGNYIQETLLCTIIRCRFWLSRPTRLRTFAHFVIFSTDIVALQRSGPLFSRPYLATLWTYEVRNRSHVPGSWYVLPQKRKRLFSKMYLFKCMQYGRGFNSGGTCIFCTFSRATLVQAVTRTGGRKC
jgi:hypothetical protein